MKTHEYKIVEASIHKSTETAANAWADAGWRVVGVLDSRKKDYADRLLLERSIEPPKNPNCWITYYSDWSSFAIFDNEDDALRYTADNHMVYSLVPFGRDVRRSI